MWFDNTKYRIRARTRSGHLRHWTSESYLSELITTWDEFEFLVSMNQKQGIVLIYWESSPPEERQSAKRSFLGNAFENVVVIFIQVLKHTEFDI